jgi:predicted CopG family antitoxin
MTENINTRTATIPLEEYEELAKIKQTLDSEDSFLQRIRCYHSVFYYKVKKEEALEFFEREKFELRSQIDLLKAENKAAETKLSLFQFIKRKYFS